jgi:hypothetical protein
MANAKATQKKKAPETVLKGNRPAAGGGIKKKPGKGRNPISEELLMAVIERMCGGESLRQICQDPKMPSVGTVLNYAMLRKGVGQEWVERFAEAYRIAKQIRAEAWADELVGIADGTAPISEDVQRNKLRIDTRKWLLSKLMKEYSEKQAHEISGPDGGPVKSESQVMLYLPDNKRSYEDEGTVDEPDSEQ